MPVDAVLFFYLFIVRLTITIDTSAGYVDYDGQIVTTNIQLESRKGVVLFKAGTCFLCNTTTGRYICPPVWSGLDCSTSVTTGRITS